MRGEQAHAPLARLPDLNSLARRGRAQAQPGLCFVQVAGLGYEQGHRDARESEQGRQVSLADDVALCRAASCLRWTEWPWPPPYRVRGECFLCAVKLQGESLHAFRVEIARFAGALQVCQLRRTDVLSGVRSCAIITLFPSRPFHAGTSSASLLPGNVCRAYSAYHFAHAGTSRLPPEEGYTELCRSH